MSLINQMLSDLERRRAGAVVHQDSAVRGLSAAHDHEFARRYDIRIVLAGIVLLASGAVAGWLLPGYFGGATTVTVGLSMPQEDTSLLNDTNTPAHAPVVVQQPGTDPAADVSMLPETDISTEQHLLAAVPAPVMAPEPEPNVTAGAKHYKTLPLRTDETVLTELNSEPAAAAEQSSKQGEIQINPRGQAEDTATSRYEHAVDLINNGHTAKAILALTELLDSEPQWDQARLLLAKELLRGRNTNVAERVLRDGLMTASSESSWRPQYADLIARILLERADVHGALAVLHQAAPEIHAGLPYYAFIAALEQRVGNHIDAIAVYRSILAVEPDQGVWWLGLGISLSATEQYQAAFEAFQRALNDQGMALNLRQYVAQELNRLKSIRA